MNFKETEQQVNLKNRVREFCAAHCDSDTAQRLSADDQFPGEIYQAMADAGLLKIPIASEFGGDSGSLLDTILITEQLARHSGTLGNIFLVNTVFCGALIQLAGSPEQKQKLLPGLSQGKLKFCFALTEPNAGSDAAAVSATAVQDGRDWLISGQKKYATGALDADCLLVVTRTDTTAKATAGMSIFLVPADADNVRITPMDKVAGNAFASCNIEFDNVRVGQASILGDTAGLNRAWSSLRITGAMERLCVAAYALGLAQAVQAETLLHANERIQFGQAIGKFQVIQHKLADMATLIEAARWLTYAAASKFDSGEDPAIEISMAKVFASRALDDIVREGLMVFGGEGFLSDSVITRYRNEALLTLYAGGTTEIQKNLIARGLGL